MRWPQGLQGGLTV